MKKHASLLCKISFRMAYKDPSNNFCKSEQKLFPVRLLKSQRWLQSATALKHFIIFSYL